MNSSIAMLIISVFALATGQILFKLISSKIETIADIASNKTALALFLAAASIYASSTLLWISALRNIPLSHAYLFISGGFILVPLASYFIFNEPITYRFMIGSAVIIAGIWMATS